ncbi:MAG: TetR/AcrR family transcriptional regulator [Spirochaetota bacterium]
MHNITLESIRRGQILDATLRTISEMGIQRVTLDDIAAASGLSKGGLAHYFATKEILFREAFREFFERIFIRSRQTMEACNTPLQKLLSFGWLYNWDDPDVNIGYPVLFDCMALAAHDEEYRTLFHEWVNSWISMLADAIVEGNNSGEFNITEVDGAARAISSVYHGIAVRWYLDRNSHSSEWAIMSFTRAIYGLLKKQLQ